MPPGGPLLSPSPLYISLSCWSYGIVLPIEYQYLHLKKDLSLPSHVSHNQAQNAVTLITTGLSWGENGGKTGSDTFPPSKSFQINPNRMLSPSLTCLKTDFSVLDMVVNKKVAVSEKCIKTDAHKGMWWEMLRFSLEGCPLPKKG